MLELDRGRGIPYEGNYSAWLEQKTKRLAQEGREDEARQRTLERESEWIASVAQGAAGQVQGALRALRGTAARRQRQGATQVGADHHPGGQRLGQNVIEVDGLKKGYGDKLLIDDLTFKLPPGGIVGVIGPNGAGKTTLFRMITGQEKPDEGTIRLGETVKLGYVDQTRDTLDANKNVWEEISGGLDIIKLGKTRDEFARLRLGSFNFKGADQQKKVGKLSGGERNRVHLAKMLQVRRQRAAARRADQRPRRRDAAGAGRGAGGFRRLRRGHQPRPLVPRPPRHPHPRLRGRQPRRMVRGQLRGLRGGQEAPARARTRSCRTGSSTRSSAADRRRAGFASASS